MEKRGGRGGGGGGRGAGKKNKIPGNCAACNPLRDTNGWEPGGQILVFSQKHRKTPFGYAFWPKISLREN